MHKVIRHYFPTIFDKFNKLPDARKRSDYKVSELLTSAIAMFLLRETSRNALNNDSREDNFKTNYFKIFGQRLPHMDTVEDFLRILLPEELEKLKASLVAGLITQKVLHRFKLLGKFYTVAIDGTGTNSYSQNDAEQTRIHKTSKNDVTTYYHHVVEAKLVTSTGLSISLASEWVSNEADKNFKKQDCEQKAFVRLAEKIKKLFPRLPLCILADGLYPNKTFMETCTNNGWAYIVVLKDDSLKGLQEDVADVENKYKAKLECTNFEAKGKTKVVQQYAWIDTILAYGAHKLYWFKCTETITHYDSNKIPLAVQPKPTSFVWLTNIKVTANNVSSLAEAGRNRWKIENEGFNTQKNGGFELGHKFSRNNFGSYKNYYQCLQIAHLISQLIEHSSNIIAILKCNKKLTIKHFWKKAIAWITHTIVSETAFNELVKCQIRLE